MLMLLYVVCISDFGVDSVSIVLLEGLIVVMFLLLFVKFYGVIWLFRNCCVMSWCVCNVFGVLGMLWFVR